MHNDNINNSTTAQNGTPHRMLLVLLYYCCTESQNTAEGQQQLQVSFIRLRIIPYTVGEGVGQHVSYEFREEDSRYSSTNQIRRSVDTASASGEHKHADTLQHHVYHTMIRTINLHTTRSTYWPHRSVLSPVRRKS